MVLKKEKNERMHMLASEPRQQGCKGSAGGWARPAAVTGTDTGVSNTSPGPWEGLTGNEHPPTPQLASHTK